ncbi:hypothetical protein JMJ35_000706 [Cladonia borealis]|uniref:CENP-V/GFA domain-containing protein n=1 Tax=Cladonia borealis TaxID=184061 RepID=A0AA39RBK3_9LECA|nr:hypothetical protein JMJ35_000706 [Cladonia borealis]
MDQPVVHKGSCHCGKVTFSILHSPKLSISECNCSICYMKGFLGLIIRASALQSLSGKENLTEYTFNTGTAKHWFCKTCGISPLTIPRSFPEGYNINFRCLQRENVREVKVTPRDGQHWEEEMGKEEGGYGKPVDKGQKHGISLAQHRAFATPCVPAQGGFFFLGGLGGGFGVGVGIVMIFSLFMTAAGGGGGGGGEGPGAAVTVTIAIVGVVGDGAGVAMTVMILTVGVCGEVAGVALTTMVGIIGVCSDVAGVVVLSMTAIVDVCGDGVGVAVLLVREVVGRDAGSS